jgi:CheY-like chemotaxis protein
MRALASEERLRALVVDDEWPARNYLVELLEGSGMAEVVGAVGDPETARETLRAVPAGMGLDVVFVDIQLGGESDEPSGLELVPNQAMPKLSG